MLIYVKIIEKKLFYGRTDGRITQNHSSEPHKKKVVLQFKKHAIYGIFSGLCLSHMFFLATSHTKNMKRENVFAT